MPAGYETVIDIYDQVLEGLDKTNNASLSPEEFESLSNECQLKIVKNRYADVERIQKRIDDLSSILNRVDLIPTATNEFDFSNAAVTAGGKLINLTPAIEGRYGYMFLLNAAVQFSYSGNACYADGVASPEVWVKSKPLKSDFLWTLREDYYGRPNDDRPYHKLESNTTGGTKLIIVNDTASTAHRVRIEYLSYPRKILLANTLSGDIDLSISLREELVRLMIETYIERIESGRVRTNAGIESQNFK